MTNASATLTLWFACVLTDSEGTTDLIPRDLHWSLNLTTPTFYRLQFELPRLGSMNHALNMCRAKSVLDFFRTGGSTRSMHDNTEQMPSTKTAQQRGEETKTKGRGARD
eukprot:1282568-Amphidinium_carterae.1